MNFTKLMKPLIAFCLAANADYANSPALGQGLHPIFIYQRIWRISPPCFDASIVRHWIPREEVPILPAQTIPSHSTSRSTTTDNSTHYNPVSTWMIVSHTESLSSMVQEAYSCRRQTQACDEKLYLNELRQTKSFLVSLHWHKRKLTSLANTCHFFHVLVHAVRVQRSKTNENDSWLGCVSLMTCTCHVWRYVCCVFVCCTLFVVVFFTKVNKGKFCRCCHVIPHCKTMVTNGERCFTVPNCHLSRTDTLQNYQGPATQCK